MTIKIAILATGDELTNGDILNTNTQEIAHALFSNGLQPGFHVSVCDAEQELTKAIQFLLQHHTVLIITGGLGPTSDDRTRFALAEVLQRELVFNEACWHAIVERHQHLGLAVIESNRQQAYFPNMSRILPNPNGTACGCHYQTESQSVFMLPGPPHECLSMFSDYVLPELIQHYASDLIQLKWKLFGVSEAEIGEKLDGLLKRYPCQTGYRWEYPYIDFKVTIRKDYADIDTLQQLITEAVADYIICPADHTAIEVLQQWLIHTQLKCVIDDNATGGLLESRLKIPELFTNVIFSDEALANTDFFKLHGLEDYWQQIPVKSTTLVIDYYSKNTKPLISNNYTLPFRNKRVRSYAVELIAYWIYQTLRQENSALE